MQTNNPDTMHTTQATTTQATTTQATTTQATTTQATIVEYDFENDDDSFYDFIDFGIALVP
jgi:hypothetical protein